MSAPEAPTLTSEVKNVDVDEAVAHHLTAGVPVDAQRVVDGVRAGGKIENEFNLPSGSSLKSRTENSTAREINETVNYGGVDDSRSSPDEGPAKGDAEVGFQAGAAGFQFRGPAGYALIVALVMIVTFATLALLGVDINWFGR